MQKKLFSKAIVFACLLTIGGCNSKPTQKLSSVDVLLGNEDQLTQVIIYDVFTPPVSSRIYVYASLASYEAIRYSNPAAKSITEKLHGFAPMPQPEVGKQYDYTLAATKAFFTSVRKMVFSVDSLNKYENSVYNRYKQQIQRIPSRRSE